MKQLELNKNDPRVAKFVRGYKGRRAIKISEATHHTVSDYWDGGSRDQTSFIDLQTGQYLGLNEVGYVQQTQNNPFNQRIGEVQIRPGLAVVVRVTFQGKDLGIRVKLHPEDFKALEG